MAEFEGNLNLNVETSEIEIKGKFTLTEEELSKVAGGGMRIDAKKGLDVIGNDEAAGIGKPHNALEAT